MKSCRVHFRTSNGTLNYNLTEDKFNDASKEDVLRYLKGLYTNKERFLDRFIKVNDNRLTVDLFTYFKENYDKVEKFNYAETFKIENDAFRALVFGSIDIVEMINELGCKRLKVDGIPVKRKQFDKDGNFTGYKEYDNIYETYEVSCEKLGLDENGYVLKCWCTSTNKEHFIWIDEKYKDSPLDAVASTFFMHENILENTKEIKRQGDLMFVEMKEGCEGIEPIGEQRCLTKDEYFNLLTCES